MAVTLADLRRRVREQADMEDSEFVTDSELNQYINSSWSELYDVLVSAYEDYFTLPPVEFTVAIGEDNFTIPSDFYKLRGVDFKFNDGDFTTVQKFQFNRRNKKNQTLIPLNATQFDRQYRLIKDKIYLTPSNSVDGTYRIWYIPQPTELATDPDELPTLALGSGWEQFVVIDATIKAMQKEESDVSILLSQKAAMLERILAMSRNRDAGSPDRIEDVNTLSTIGFWEF